MSSAFKARSGRNIVYHSGCQALNFRTIVVKMFKCFCQFWMLIKPVVGEWREWTYRICLIWVRKHVELAVCWLFVLYLKLMCIYLLIFLFYLFLSWGIFFVNHCCFKGAPAITNSYAYTNRKLYKAFKRYYSFVKWGKTDTNYW